MNYQETVAYLFSMLPMYQRQGISAYKKDLSNTYALLKELGNPHNKIKTVHVAGTNGKGTCTHALAAIFQLAGYKTGLYTSPHLKRFTERIKIDGEEVPEAFVIDFVARLKVAIERIKPSFFELTVAMAFDYFAQNKVDIAIVETGLGGRLDSTNVINPEACLITNIGMDHTDLLGDTLEKIAREKAGIIKPNVPVIIGKYQDEVAEVFKKKAAEAAAPLYMDQEPKRIPDSIDQYHKRLNYNGIATTAEVMTEKGWKLSKEHVSKGIENFEKITGLKGRFQQLRDNPIVIADIAHNQEGLQELFIHIKEQLDGKLHIVFGTVKDKDLAPILSVFPKQAHFYWTASSVPRSLEVETLSQYTHENGFEGVAFPSVNDALAAALSHADRNDKVVVTGSTFVVAELDDL